LKSGKTDKKLLAAIFHEHRPFLASSGSTLTSTFPANESPKWNELERKVANVIATLFGLDDALAALSPIQPLSSYGLDSLSAIRLSSLLREAGMPISVSQILNLDTIRLLANAIASAESQHAQTQDPQKTFSRFIEDGRNLAKVACAEIKELVGCEGIYPCTPTQLWMLVESLASSGTVYNNSLLFEIEKKPWVTVDTVREAWTRIVTKNEILRTGFLSRDRLHSHPVPLSFGAKQHPYYQIVWSQTSISLNWKQFELKPHQQIEHFSQKHIDSAKIQTIDDMFNPPVSCWCISDASSKRFWLSVVCHHTLYDGWSMRLIQDDLNLLLNAQDTTTVQLPDRPPFTSVVYRAVSTQPDTKFWTGCLQGIPDFSEFPNLTRTTQQPKLPSPNNTNNNNNSRRSEKFKIDSVDVAELDARCQTLNVSPQVLLQAAWAKLLRLYTGEADVVFGLVLSGRTVPLDGIERVVGPCVNCVPCRVFVPGLEDEDEGRVLLESIRGGNVKALAHAEVHVSEIKRALVMEERGRTAVGFGRNLHDSVVIYHRFPQDVESPSARSTVELTSYSNNLEISVAVELKLENGFFSLQISYNPTAIDEAQVKLMLRQLVDLMLIDLLKLNVPPCTPHDAYSKVNLRQTSNEVLDLLQLSSYTPKRTSKSFDSMLMRPLPKMSKVKTRIQNFLKRSIALCTAREDVPPTPTFAGNLNAYVVDVNGSVVLPLGAVGEVCVDVEYKKVSNSEAEIVTLEELSTPLYRTGYLGRAISGTLSIIGKMDSMVSLNGSTIDLQKISSELLMSCSSLIQNAVSLVLKHPSQNTPLLVSFVVRRHGDATPLEDEKMAQQLFARMKLPPYKTPSYIIPMAQLPISSARVIDHERLATMFTELSIVDLNRYSHCKSYNVAELALPDQMAAHVEMIIGEMREISNVSSITPYTSLYELGIDSLTAMRLVGNLRKLGHNVHVSDLMQYPSALTLAHVLYDKQMADHQGHVTLKTTRSFEITVEKLWTALKREVSRSDIVEVLPCTPLQEGMLVETLASEGSVYFNHTALQLHSSVNVEKLQEAWLQLCRHASILRTRFEIVDHENEARFVQYVVSGPPPALEHVELDSADQLSLAFDDLCEETTNLLDFRQPVKASVLMAPTENWLVISLHHAIYDGWSFSLLLNLLAKFYNDLSTLVDVGNHRDFLEYIYNLDIKDTANFWEKYLKDGKVAPFPVLRNDKPEAPNQIISQKRVGVKLSDLQQLCARYQTTMTVLGESVWGIVLSRYLNSHDVTFGQVWSGRTVPVEKIETILGPCFNTIPVRVRIDGSASLKEYIQSVHESHVAVSTYQHTALKDIQRMISPDGRKLFDTILQYRKVSVDDETELVQPWKKIKEFSSTN
ncbi:hypothetical protein HDV05_006628, partial [Chytridiales sp. JEL 0842]